MYLKPCRNCPHKDGCELKAAKLKSLQGLGITFVNFKCPTRLYLLPPGQKVKLELWQDSGGGYQDRDGDDFEFTATVMRPHKTRILVWLDEHEELDSPARNPIPVHPDRVTPIPGRVKLCSECDQPEGTKPMERDQNSGKSEFHCWKCKGLPDPRIEYEASLRGCFS